MTNRCHLASYARYYDTVLIRTPDDAPLEDPSSRAFDDPERVRLLAHRGRFWLFQVGDKGTNLFQKRAGRETMVE